MEYSPAGEASRFSASQENSRILWNFNHKSPPPVPNPEPDQSSPCTSPHFLKIILILPSHLSLALSSGLFPSYFPIETLYAPPFSPLHVICTTHLIPVDLNI